MVGLGTLVNSGAILAGAGAGLLLRRGLPEKWQESIMQGVALCIIVIGVQMAFKSENIMVVIFSIVLGAIGGVLGYLIFAFENYFSFPVDTGAVSVILVGVLGRILFNQEDTYNEKNLDFLEKASPSFWEFQFLIGLAVSTVMAY